MTPSVSISEIPSLTITTASPAERLISAISQSASSSTPTGSGDPQPVFWKEYKGRNEFSEFVL